jgi:hypothetical protein
MSMIARFFLALAVLVIDFIVFFIPLTALFMAYVIIVNPFWFRNFLERLDRHPTAA